jgi:hypothetical protein
MDCLAGHFEVPANFLPSHILFEAHGFDYFSSVWYDLL